MRVILFFIGVALLSGCSVAPHNGNAFTKPNKLVDLSEIKINSKSEIIKVSKDNYIDEIDKCLGMNFKNDDRFVREAFKDFPPNNIVSYYSKDEGDFFINRKTEAVCLKRSEYSHPVFSTNDFSGTVNPTGVPSNVAEGWYRKIAKNIAAYGFCIVAYKMENGNAFVATYYEDSDRPYMMDYKVAYAKAGKWETSNIDYVFSYPDIGGIMVKSRGQNHRKGKMPLEK